MKLFHRLFLFALVPFITYSQEFILLTTLPETLSETSGLIYLNQKLITHNDSGQAAELYEIDINSGAISRTVTISNATNIDWEDISYDDTYIYIGDFGNNSGSRTNLKIYRILISDYVNNTTNIVTVDIINFDYADQTDFTPNLFATNFDAEALISYGDNLFIFTKNWIDNKTNVYAIPKSSGTYSVDKIDSFDSQGLITAASYNPLSNMIVLSGYTFSAPFIIELKDFSLDIFSNGTINRYEIQPPSGYSTQVEAITFFDENQYYLTAEKSITNENSGLYTLNTNTLGFKTDEVSKNIIFPNPASDTIQINFDGFSYLEIYDLQGKLLKTASKLPVDISDLDTGIYLINIQNINSGYSVINKLVVD